MSDNKTYSSESVLQKRIKSFKKIKRGYFALIFLGGLYLLSFLNPILISDKALAVKYNGEYSFPAFSDLLSSVLGEVYYDGKDFGQAEGTPHYRQIKQNFKQEGQGNWVLMPLYPYGPYETLLREFPEGVKPPTAPDTKNLFGTDTQGRDIFARTMYGFQISISFALIVTFLSYMLGIIIGALLGYYGGRVDLYGVRLIEIFSTIPFLFTLIILVKYIRPSFLLLAAMYVVLKGWIGISYYVRGEFYREKNRDYVAAGIAMGQNDFKLMFKHILPNALTSVITFAPFAIIGYISALVSLDFLGFGLPVPTPSWGELIQQGSQNISYWWLIVTPLFMMFFTLSMITFIGEAVRQAFDPRIYSRLQ